MSVQRLISLLLRGQEYTPEIKTHQLHVRVFSSLPSPPYSTVGITLQAFYIPNARKHNCSSKTNSHKKNDINPH